MNVLTTRTRTIGFLVPCGNNDCSNGSIVKFFTRGDDTFVEYETGWQAIPRQSTTQPLVVIDFRCSAHHVTIPEAGETIADEIRRVTSRNELHPLVRDNLASPRGLCNCSKSEGLGPELGIVFCQLDYGHEGEHSNGPYHWEERWPP